MSTQWVPGGFYKLYQIDVRSEDDDADSGRGKQRGLKSPYGRRGAICAHMHWTWDYLHNGIAWSVVERMMSDLPSYDFDSKTDDSVKLKKDNAKDIMNYINNLA